MDIETIRAYDERAGAFAVEWEQSQSTPDDLRAIVRQYFVPGKTVDVGCGSGRDTAWLVEYGFDALGVDASCGLIAEARRRHHGIRFEVDALPELITLENGIYKNVLCETVIMHLDVEHITKSVQRLRALLAPGGTLYLTWRVTKGGDNRDDSGRLYTAFEAPSVLGGLSGADILLNEQCLSASSGKLIHRILARKIGKGGRS